MEQQTKQMFLVHPITGKLIRMMIGWVCTLTPVKYTFQVDTYTSEIYIQSRKNIKVSGYLICNLHFFELMPRLMVNTNIIN